MLTSFLFHESDPQVISESADLLVSCESVLSALKEGVPDGLQAIEFLLDFEECAGEQEPFICFPSDLMARVRELRIDLQLALHNGYVSDFDRAARLDHNVQFGMNYTFGLASVSEDSAHNEWSNPIQRADSSASLFEKLFSLSSARWNSAINKFQSKRANLLWVEIPSGKWAYHEFVTLQLAPDLLDFAEEEGWLLAVIPERFHVYSPEIFSGDPGVSPFAQDADGTPYSVEIGFEFGIKNGALAEWGFFGDGNQR